jgi:hypothetical protein
MTAISSPEAPDSKYSIEFHSTDIDSTLRSCMKHPIANAPQPRAKRRKHQESLGRALSTTPIDSQHSVEHAMINSTVGSSTPQLTSTKIPHKHQPTRKVVPLKPVSLIQNYEISNLESSRYRAPTPYYKIPQTTRKCPVFLFLLMVPRRCLDSWSSMVSPKMSSTGLN